MSGELSQPLTAAERRAARLLAEGFTYRQIAETLALSERTIKNQVASAAAKIPGDLPLRLRVIEWYRSGRTFSLSPIE